MAKTKTSSAVKQRYNEKAYDRLAITIPKGKKNLVQQAAEAAGESVNSYVTRAVLMRMGLESWPETENSAESE